QPPYRNSGELDLAGAGKGLLKPGLYSHATTYSPKPSTAPGLLFKSPNLDCDNVTGKFKVFRAEYSANGVIKHFAADFEQHCVGNDWVSIGKIRYNHASSAYLSGILHGNTDPERDRLTAVLVRPPAHGRLILKRNGVFTYRPERNFAGIDTFQYKSNDGAKDSNIATVRIRVEGVNDSPTFVAGADQSVNQDSGP